MKQLPEQRRSVDSRHFCLLKISEAKSTSESKPFRDLVLSRLFMHQLQPNGPRD